MKILHLVTRRQYRGAEVFAANLSEELIDLGHEIIFAGLYENPVNPLVVPHALNLDFIQHEHSFFSIFLVSKIVKLVEEEEPDVIQCNGSDTLKYMVAASYFIPKTPILYRNISIISKWLADGPKKYLYRHFFKRISHVSSVGDAALQDFVRILNYPPEKTSVIRRGIPLNTVDPEKARLKLVSSLGLKKEDKLVIHVGNFSPEKNHQFLLEVFSKLQDSHPEIKLLCIGDGTLFNEIKKGITELNLQSTVFLLGFQKDIPEYLAGGDCLVLSSKVEGVPGVILEAAAQKKPSIATNVGGVSEVLLNGKTGFYIDNFDQEIFSSQLVKLLSDDNLRKRMGENAYELVVAEYSPGKNAKKFEILYQELIQKGN